MSDRKLAEETWPLTIKSGNGLAMIYRSKNRDQWLYTVTYQQDENRDGKIIKGRKRKNFKDLAKAKREAAGFAKRIHEGLQQADSLTAADVAVYSAALKALPPGKGLLEAVTDYATGLTELKGRGTILEAARHFTHHRQDVVPKLVSDVVKELLAAKRADGLSELYIKDLEVRLNKFANHFKTFIGNIGTKEIDAWSRGLGIGQRSRNNYATAITTLFKFAKVAGDLPKDRETAADSISRGKVKARGVDIFTPEQMSDLLSNADNLMLPFIAIAGFSGLRHWEIKRLSWKDMNFEEGHITVEPEKSKTGSRRLAPIPDNLGQWLAPYKGMDGQVMPQIKIITRLLQIAKDAGIMWKKNALRHSFASYRLRQINDAQQVALEMGNSPAMIFKHYHKLVTPQETAKWFAIAPEQAKNVVPMKRAKGAA